MGKSLILSHKRKLTLYPDLFTVSCISESEQVGGGKRGKIKIFSRASRKRLFEELHKLIFETVTFITLTYPEDFPVTSKIYKAHLKEFRRRIEVKWGKISAFWRLEFQKRGAPHYHIMFFDCPPFDHFEISWVWKCVTHTWDMAHELLGANVRLITDGRQERLIAFYVGKYIAKVDERTENSYDEHTGRWWGRWNIEDEKPMEFTLPDWQAKRAVTFALDCRMGGTGWEPVDRTICTVFGGSLGSSEFSQLIRGYLDYVGRPER